jgi:hypothetical protein
MNIQAPMVTSATITNQVMNTKSTNILRTIARSVSVTEALLCNIPIQPSAS